MPKLKVVTTECAFCHKEKEHVVRRVVPFPGAKPCEDIDALCRDCTRDQKQHRTKYVGRLETMDNIGGANGKWNDQNHRPHASYDSAVQDTGLARRKGGGTLANADPVSVTQIDNDEDEVVEMQADIDAKIFGPQNPRKQLNLQERVEFLVDGHGGGSREVIRYQRALKEMDFGGLTPGAIQDLKRSAAVRAVLDTTFPDWRRMPDRPDAEYQMYGLLGPETRNKLLTMFKKMGIAAPEPTVALNKDGAIRPVRYLTKEERIENSAAEMRAAWAVRSKGGRPRKNNP